jgi:hypothetical protein
MHFDDFIGLDDRDCEHPVSQMSEPAGVGLLHAGDIVRSLGLLFLPDYTDPPRLTTSAMCP